MLDLTRLDMIFFSSFLIRRLLFHLLAMRDGRTLEGGVYDFYKAGT